MAGRILLAIPVYNEAGHLPRVLAGVLQLMDSQDVLIIDDGSTDGTLAEIEHLGLNTLRHPQNEGKGFSLLQAWRYAKEREYDWLLCMDGDGQHDPADIPLFIQHIARDQADVFLGDRMQRAGHMPLQRQWSNRLSSLILSLLINNGQRLTDTQCGFRALRVSMLQNAWFREKGFQFESEVLLVLGRRGRRIRQIPIQTRYAQEKSSINPLTDTLRFLKLVFRSLW
ncbi:MAG TPA: glycosyltransferase family 2 protein [bacterium]|nr:glycosyltransferase family 2 protein [bacterium]